MLGYGFTGSKGGETLFGADHLASSLTLFQTRFPQCLFVTLNFNATLGRLNEFSVGVSRFHVAGFSRHRSATARSTVSRSSASSYMHCQETGDVEKSWVAATTPTNDCTRRVVVIVTS